MALSLIAGPASAGKVALLLERYLAALEREPVLIVPNRSDVDRVEHDLLARRPALLGGTIGTFDRLFERIARGGRDARPVLGESQRSLLVRRIVGGASLNGLGRSARFAGFADELGRTLAELEEGLLEPDVLDGDLARLYLAYRAELDRLGRWDPDLLRRRAVERLQNELDAWSGEPVFAYGFEDLTGAEWELLRALAGRTEVTVSLPYEAGRPAFESLRRTMDDLSALADGQITELPPRFHEFAPAPLAHLERALFADRLPDAPPLDGSLRFLEAAGVRGTLELVGQEILSLVRGGMDPERIAVVCASLERVRAPLETAFGSLGVPIAPALRPRLPQTPFGRALLGLLRFVWLGAGRRELYGFLRTPYSGVPHAKVDFLEGRLRGRAINAHDRVEAETLALHGNPFPIVKELREAETPLAGLRSVAARMLRHAYGLNAPPTDDDARRDLRAYEALVRLVDELEGWLALGGTLTTDEIVGALERTNVRGADGREPGRVAVLDLLRVRTRSFDAVFVLGLEEGSLPRRGQTSAFLDDDARTQLADARLVKPDQVARDRYLFYTACTRATTRLYLVREAATDDGMPLEPSPFWDEVVRLFPREEVERATTRRALSSLTWPLESAPSERERLRSLAADDRRGRRREAPRIRRAHGAEPVLQRHPEAARNRAARHRASGRGARVLAHVPRPGAERRAHGADRAAAARARPVALARPRGGRARGGRVGGAARSVPLRGVVRRRAVDSRRPRARRRADAVGEDRPRRRGDVRRARNRPGLQVGTLGALRVGDRAGAAPADPALHARSPRSRRHRAARRALPSARRRTQAARPAARLREGGAAGLHAHRLPRRRRVLAAARDRAHDGARPCAAHPRGRRGARSARRLVSVVVRPLADVQGETSVNEQQLAAVEARGEVFVSAGAGTGKTSVLVERFVRAVCDDGLDVGSILVITYTKRAAGELRSRIRARLLELGRVELARELDGAWISTIHGFCNRLLKTYPLDAGLDPRFRELDDAQGAVVRSEAFEAALAEFCADAEPERLRLLATYRAAGLRRMVIGVYETLRSAGRELVLELGEGTSLPEALERLADAARCVVDDSAASEVQREAAQRALELHETAPAADELLDLSGLKARGERAASYVEALDTVEQAALDAAAARDHALLQTLLGGFAAHYQTAKDRESVLDFEDLQLRARDLLKGNERVRSRESLRFRSIMVDEFQDTNRLQCELIDLLAGHADVFFVGDEFQSIYGFRHADVTVFRERRAAAKQVLPLTQNYRSRAEVLAVVNELFAGEFGDEFQPLHASSEFPDPVFGPPAELLVTDKSSYANSEVHWRRAEARHIAKRVRELVDSGAAEPGEIVLLFAAGTDAEHYEEELRKAGLRTYRSTGRGYFGQQQVVDLLGYLRLLHNHDYDLAVLARWDGRRRYANLRKLARLARSYEELRGADVEGFVRFVADQEAVGAKELEAVAEEEGGDAVRLLTIHAAKGLEFKVVVVADAGRDRQPPAP